MPKEDQEAPRRPALSPLFPTGGIVMTRGAMASVPMEEAMVAVVFHQHGYWGSVCAEDVDANERALVDGERLLSSYATKLGVKFWVITEADRSSTTVLLPEEY